MKLKIGFISEKNKGSKFFILFPIKKKSIYEIINNQLQTNTNNSLAFSNPKNESYKNSNSRNNDKNKKSLFQKTNYDKNFTKNQEKILENLKNSISF